MKKYLLSAAAVLMTVSVGYASNFSYFNEGDKSIPHYGYFGERFPSSKEDPSSGVHDEKVYSTSGGKKLRGDGKIIHLSEKDANFDKTVLNDEADYLTKHPSDDLYIVGHSGGHEKGKIAQTRAEEVKKYLVVEKGIDAGRLHIVPAGENMSKKAGRYVELKVID